MMDVTFDARIPGVYGESTTPILLNGHRAGEIESITTMEWNGKFGCPARWTISEYLVRIPGNISVFRAEDYATGSRGALAAAKRWVKNSLNQD